MLIGGKQKDIGKLLELDFLPLTILIRDVHVVLNNFIKKISHSIKTPSNFNFLVLDFLSTMPSSEIASFY
jgi:hypothetical protein